MLQAALVPPACDARARGAAKRTQRPPRSPPRTTALGAATPGSPNLPLRTSGHEPAGEGVVHVVEQHDDQHTSVRVVEQPGVYGRPYDGEQVGVDPDVLPGYYERRVPGGPQHPQDQASKERRAPDLQPWQGVAPEARLLPSTSEA